LASVAGRASLADCWPIGAIDKSFDVNYGLHAEPGGANIPLVVPTGGATVTFYYDNASHWVTADLTAPIVTAGGSFQSELGCAADWAPDCLRSWLQDVDGDGIYTFTTTAIPAGDYEVKAALGLSWDVNYGQGGVPGGANIPFTVARDTSPTTFSYDSTSHVLSVSATAGLPTITTPKAYWLSRHYLAWEPRREPGGGDLRVVRGAERRAGGHRNRSHGRHRVPLDLRPRRTAGRTSAEVPRTGSSGRPAAGRIHSEGDAVMVFVPETGKVETNLVTDP
jgi:Pullulanase X25 domain